MYILCIYICIFDIDIQNEDTLLPVVSILMNNVSDTQLAQTPVHTFREILHNCDNMTAYFSISSYTGVRFDLIPCRRRIKKN